MEQSSMEYRILSLEAKADTDTESINEMARDGWELMQVVAPGYSEYEFNVTAPLYAVLRRPV